MSSSLASSAMPSPSPTQQTDQLPNIIGFAVALSILVCAVLVIVLVCFCYGCCRTRGRQQQQNSDSVTSRPSNRAMRNTNMIPMPSPGIAKPRQSSSFNSFPSTGGAPEMKSANPYSPGPQVVHLSQLPHFLQAQQAVTPSAPKQHQHTRHLPPQSNSASRKASLAEAGGLPPLQVNPTVNCADVGYPYQPCKTPKSAGNTKPPPPPLNSPPAVSSVSSALDSSLSKTTADGDHRHSTEV